MKVLPAVLLVLFCLVAWSAAARYRRYHNPRRGRAGLPRAMRAIERRVYKDSYSRERFLALPQLPYPYYQRPKYRYPFYDVEGNGHLLYGYGDRRLYSYKQFKPLEGYSKRR